MWVSARPLTWGRHTSIAGLSVLALFVCQQYTQAVAPLEAAEAVGDARATGYLMVGLFIIVTVLLAVAGGMLQHEIDRRVAAERALRRALHDAERKVDSRVRQMAAELRQETLRANRVREDRLAAVSHELRTPLNAIVGWAQVLKIDNDGNRGRAIEAIERNAFAESRLIAELLEVSPSRSAGEARDAVPGTRAGPDTNRTRAGTARDLKLRVLVVEDDADAAVTLRTLLEQRGCDVRVARTMNEGVKAFALARPDVLLCDIGLPDGDGCTLLGLVRAQDAEHPVPAIALSAAARESDRSRATAAGFASYMTKPYEVDELFDLVGRVATSADADVDRRRRLTRR
jgi:CheY-like chemotaxis protein